jgi:Arc/MetJ-type ribon-helix-helix transcriptional regulator
MDDNSEKGVNMSDTEKITINMSVVDLGQVDLLVKEGFYSSRTDFIRTAIRNLLNAHSEKVKELVAKKSFAMGVISFNKRDLEEIRAKGVKLEIKALGLCILANDISPELALATISSIEVLGVLRASEPVKDALGKRIL